MWADWLPDPNPARPTLRPLLGLTPGLSSHKCTRSRILNPGLPFESPGALPTHHTGAPTGPRELCGQGTGEVITPHWSCDLDRKPGWNHLKDSFWTISVNMTPSRSGPHSKKLWICRSEVGPWNESLANSVYSDASPPRPTFRSPELQPSHSAQLRPLRRGGFRAGIS